MKEGDVFGRNIGIDLGTTSTSVYVEDQGIVFSEPSIVAVDETTNEVVAVGNAAKNTIGRTPANVVATRPLKDGVIADFEATKKLLSYVIGKTQPQHGVFRSSVLGSMVGPRVVVCVPSGATGVELKAVRQTVESVGARQTFLVEEPLAAAIGAGMPMNRARGNMVVDIGGGTTEVAVISSGGIATKASVRIAGDDMDGAIAAYVQNVHKVAIGTQAAEQLKIELGSALPLPKEESAEIKGRDLATGLPTKTVVTSEEVREAIGVHADAIVAAVRDTLDRTPPELASDIAERGMVLVGGGAMLRLLDERLRKETGVPVHVADDPLMCVALGGGRCLEEFEHYRNALSYG